MLRAVQAKSLLEHLKKRVDDAKAEHARLSGELARATKAQKNELQDRVMTAFHAIEAAEDDLNAAMVCTPCTLLY